MCARKVRSGMWTSITDPAHHEKCVFKCVFGYTHTHTHARMHTHTHKQKHKNMHTHTHTHIHAHTHGSCVRAFEAVSPTLPAIEKYVFGYTDRQTDAQTDRQTYG